MRMTRLSASLLVIALLIIVAMLGSLAACSSSTANTTPPTTTTTATQSTGTSPATTASPGGEAISIDLVAQNLAFNMTTITVPAGATVTVNFDNKDNSIPHNLAVYTNSSASDSIFVGEIITGPKTITYKFTAPSTPGTYFFRCDTHPTMMTGEFIVQ
jgi:plastocyanin